MSANLDRALDDIISESGQNSRPASARRGSGISGRLDARDRGRHSDNRRGSPYSRNNSGQQFEQSSSRKDHSHRGQWTHDLYDGPRTINERLGARKPSLNSRIGSNDASKAKEQKNKMPKRGIAIAGSGRDAAPYEAFLVIWVAGLPHSFTEDKIKDVFSDVGRIDKIRMAIDSKGRFLGKAEITYRLADDARSAVQVFDGETLYGADLAHVEPLRVTYSDIEKSAYLDNLKFENTLPEPKEIPLQMRLGVPGAQFVPYTLMPVNVQGAGQQAYSQERLGSNMGGRLSGPRRNQSGGYPKRRTDTSNESRPTPDQLDADLDAYMSSKAEGASAAAQPSAEPTQDSATAEQ